MLHHDLSGTWTLSACSGREKNIPARVPGDTHSALLEAGRIADPFYGRNELDLQWLGREDWELVRTFEVDRELLSQKAVFLVCEQLDTFAEIFINDSSVGHTENMFRRYVFDVKSQLRAGPNSIRIRFTSAEKTAEALAKTMPYKIPYGSNIVQSP
ncbi:MAG: glycoside hydrolase family 2 protein, partial [Planctomycetes bacterium]|nr:glycoside hydrolase family 2 protein [Planctomycetota bacterium]